MDFDDLTDIYDALIDWPKRLAAEGAFYQPMLERAGVKAIADVACGTGRHAAMFRDWGLDVIGADLSLAMLARARQLFGESPQLQWRQQSFDQPIAPAGSLDAVVCLGNSLALVKDRAQAHQALRTMIGAVRPGGLTIVHVLNVWALPDGPPVWQKSVRRSVNGQAVLLVKGVQRQGESARVNLLVIPPDAPEQFRTESVPFLALRGDDLAATAEACGAAAQLFGSVKGSPYDAANSVDLTLVATRR
jgi:glycine/sarcosine N-methyltransferase